MTDIDYYIRYSLSYLNLYYENMVSMKLPVFIEEELEDDYHNRMNFLINRENINGSFNLNLLSNDEETYLVISRI